jgi:hypothetical protein
LASVVHLAVERVLDQRRIDPRVAEKAALSEKMRQLDRESM